jgi:hypothetical protein
MFRVDHHHYGLGTGGWWLLMRQPCHATLDDRPPGFGSATVTCRPLSCWESLTLAQRQSPANPRHVKALVHL